MEKEALVLISQNRMGWLSVLKKLSLILSDVKRRLYPLLNRRDGCVNSIRLVDKPEKPFIQIYGMLCKLEKLMFSLLVGFGNSIPRPYGKVCGKAKLFPCFTVNHVVESNWVKHSPFKRYFREVIACTSKGLKGGDKLLYFFLGWLKFTDRGFRELHQSIYINSVFKSFLPWLKHVGLFKH